MPAVRITRPNIISITHQIYPQPSSQNPMARSRKSVVYICFIPKCLRRASIFSELDVYNSDVYFLPCPVRSRPVQRLRSGYRPLSKCKYQKEKEKKGKSKAKQPESEPKIPNTRRKNKENGNTEANGVEG